MGIYGATNFSATAGSGLSISLTAGSGFVENNSFANSAQAITFCSADATFPRKDVVYWDYSLAVATHATGSAAPSPRPQDLANSHVPIVTVSIPATGTQVQGSWLTDGRVSYAKPVIGNFGTVNATYVNACGITGSKVTACAFVGGSLVATNITVSTLTASQVNSVGVTTCNITASYASIKNIDTCGVTVSAITACALTISLLTACDITAGAIETPLITASTVTASTINASKLIVSSNIDAGTITACTVTCSSITASTASVTNKLTTGSMEFKNITGSTATVSSLTASTIAVTNQAVVGCAVIDKITACNITTSYLTASNIAVTNKVTAGSGVIDKITACNISTSYLTASNIAVTNKVTSGSGDITTLSTDALTACGITASSVTTCSITADEIYTSAITISDGSIDASLAYIKASAIWAANFSNIGVAAGSQNPAFCSVTAGSMITDCMVVNNGITASLLSPNTAYPDAVLTDGSRKMTGNLEIEGAAGLLILDSTTGENTQVRCDSSGVTKAYFGYVTGNWRFYDQVGTATRMQIARSTGNITQVGNINLGGNNLSGIGGMTFSQITLTSTVTGATGTYISATVNGQQRFLLLYN